MDTLKFPITFDKGRVGYLTEGSREYYAQILSLAVQIRIGELPLEPIYGISDPTFSTFDKGELFQTLNYYWPEIQVNSIDSRFEPSRNQYVVDIDFSN